MPPSPFVSHCRAKVARAKQSYPDDHPKVVEAVRDLHDAMLAERVEKVIADFPKLSEQQQQRVAAMFTAGSVA